MFTGIVTAIGRVIEARPESGGLDLTIEAPYQDLALGESIAVDGACLTVTGLADGAFAAHVIDTSLERTRFGRCPVGFRVNLERALQVGDRLGGHLVQGHVDGVAAIVSRSPAEHWDVVRIAIPPGLARYIVEKGSIAVDGVSLTVSAVGGGGGGVPPWFEVSLIPATLSGTTLGGTQPGSDVNLEVDVIGKYVERLMAGQEAAVRP